MLKTSSLLEKRNKSSARRVSPAKHLIPTESRRFAAKFQPASVQQNALDRDKRLATAGPKGPWVSSISFPLHLSTVFETSRALRVSIDQCPSELSTILIEAAFEAIQDKITVLLVLTSLRNCLAVIGNEMQVMRNTRTRLKNGFISKTLQPMLRLDLC